MYVQSDILSQVVEVVNVVSGTEKVSRPAERRVISHFRNAEERAERRRVRDSGYEVEDFDAVGRFWEQVHKVHGWLESSDIHRGKLYIRPFAAAHGEFYSNPTRIAKELVQAGNGWVTAQMVIEAQALHGVVYEERQLKKCS